MAGDDHPYSLKGSTLLCCAVSISTLLHGPILAQVTFPTGDPEEALAKALLLQRLVANSSGGADFVVKLQQSKLLMMLAPYVRKRSRLLF